MVVVVGAGTADVVGAVGNVVATLLGVTRLVVVGTLLSGAELAELGNASDSLTASGSDGGRAVASAAPTASTTKATTVHVKGFDRTVPSWRVVPGYERD